MKEANKMEEPVWEPLLISKDGDFSGRQGRTWTVTGQAK